MSKIHIDDQIIMAKQLVNNAWPTLSTGPRIDAKAIVETLQWIRDNADVIRMAAKVAKDTELKMVVEQALHAKTVWPGAEASLKTPEGTDVD